MCMYVNEFRWMVVRSLPRLQVITPEEFKEFVARHSQVDALVPEDNDTMRNSYVIAIPILCELLGERGCGSAVVAAAGAATSDWFSDCCWLARVCVRVRVHVRCLQVPYFRRVLALLGQL